MISAKYGEEEVEWCFREMKEGTGVGFWKSIRKDWGLVSSRISFLVGNG